MDLQEKLNELLTEFNLLASSIESDKLKLKGVKKSIKSYGKLIEKAKALEKW